MHSQGLGLRTWYTKEKLEARIGTQCFEYSTTETEVSVTQNLICVYTSVQAKEAEVEILPQKSYHTSGREV